MSKDKIELKHPSAISIGILGRILDHFDANRFSKNSIKTLVLDEFDKLLESGFEVEMNAIINRLEHLELGILNAATQGVKIPGFVGWNAARIVTYLMDRIPSKLDIKTVVAQEKDKMKTLVDLLLPTGMASGHYFLQLQGQYRKGSPLLRQERCKLWLFYRGNGARDGQQKQKPTLSKPALLL